MNNSFADLLQTKPKESHTSVPDEIQTQNDDTRLWIGNLDGRLSEYQLIKMLQKFGKVVKFDFLFHKSGPLQGQPRGYCFVTYENQEQARRALRALDGCVALTKKLSVKWAHLKMKEDDEQHKRTNAIVPGLTTLPTVKSEISLSTKIRAIEAKLKLMEENKDHESLVIQPLTLPCVPAAPERRRKQTAGTRRAHSNPYRKHRTQNHRYRK